MGHGGFRSSIFPIFNSSTLKEIEVARQSPEGAASPRAQKIDRSLYCDPVHQKRKMVTRAQTLAIEFEFDF
jgi:hypothetical protein